MFICKQIRPQSVHHWRQQHTWTSQFSPHTQRWCAWRFGSTCYQEENCAPVPPETILSLLLHAQDCIPAKTVVISACNICDEISPTPGWQRSQGQPYNLHHIITDTQQPSSPRPSTHQCSKPIYLEGVWYGCGATVLLPLIINITMAQQPYICHTAMQNCSLQITWHTDSRSDNFDYVCFRTSTYSALEVLHLCAI